MSWPVVRAGVEVPPVDVAAAQARPTSARTACRWNTYPWRRCRSPRRSCCRRHRRRSCRRRRRREVCDFWCVAGQVAAPWGSRSPADGVSRKWRSLRFLEPTLKPVEGSQRPDAKPPVILHAAAQQASMLISNAHPDERQSSQSNNQFAEI